MKAVTLSIVLCILAAPASAEKITLGVVPQQSPLKMFKVWKPITKYLSEKTGHDVVFKTEKSIAEFEKVLYNGGYDLAYMNPYHFVVANRTQNYQAVVRAKKMIKGILVAKSESVDFDQLIQSKNTRYLFPSPNAFAATLLTKFELLTKYGIDVNQQERYKYVNSHDSVYSGIARSTGDLGGGIQRTFSNFGKQKDKQQLNIIYTTNAYPSHPIAFNPNLSTDLQKKLKTALLNIPSDLISRLSIKKIIPSNNEEFDSIRQLESKLAIVERK